MSGVDLNRLRALTAAPFTMSLSDIEELRSLAAAAATELAAWRTRFEHDDPEGFDVYEDDDDGGFYTVTRPTAEEVAERHQRWQESQWAAESRRMAPLWPPPPDPNEVVGVRSDGMPVTRGMLGEGSDALAMVQYLKGWATAGKAYAVILPDGVGPRGT